MLVVSIKPAKAAKASSARRRPSRYAALLSNGLFPLPKSPIGDKFVTGFVSPDNRCPPFVDSVSSRLKSVVFTSKDCQLYLNKAG